MDPLGIAQSALSTINYIKTAADKVKENKHECRRLCSHAKFLLDLIQTKFKNGIPDDIQPGVSKLANTLLGLSAAIDELSEGSLFKRTISRNSISAQIQSAYRDIEDEVRNLHLGLLIDLHRFQQENQEARREDVATAENNFSRISRKREDEVLQTLQIPKRQIPEAMLCLNQYLATLPPKSVERQLLGVALSALQRRSVPLKTVADEFVITSFDVIIFRDKRLGEGGFATVYEADWKGAKVAVKELEKGASTSAVQQEIDIWKRLRHPHILQFLGACTISEPAFLVCSLKPNGDIISYLHKNPRANRTKLLHEASLGLTYLHNNNVIHGDLKGTNILVDEHGAACIADFGLSKIKIHSTPTPRSAHASEFGTLRWMSPESMASRVSNEKSDVYSFGMTMYEVYSGKPPFADMLDEPSLRKFVRDGGRPERLDNESGRIVGLTGDIWSIIVRSWSQAPEDRPSATSISNRIARVLAAPPKHRKAPIAQDATAVAPSTSEPPSPPHGPRSTRVGRSPGRNAAPAKPQSRKPLGPHNTLPPVLILKEFVSNEPVPTPSLQIETDRSGRHSAPASRSTEENPFGFLSPTVPPSEVQRYRENLLQVRQYTHKPNRSTGDIRSTLDMDSHNVRSRTRSPSRRVAREASE